LAREDPTINRPPVQAELSGDARFREALFEIMDE
jgi:hypothetical protein